MKKLLLLSMILAAAGWCQQPPDKQEEERRRSMRATMDAIMAECQSSAGGDWRKWFDSLAPFREQLRAVMDRESRFNIRTSSLDSKHAIAYTDPTKAHRPVSFLTAAGTPPLMASQFVGYYISPPAPDPFEWGERLSSNMALKATRRWLKTKGIDLIVVPVPTVVDVYPDRVVGGGIPENRIVQPHVRKFFYDLLSSDIEIVDLLPAFLEAGRKRLDSLYLVGDIHWGPAGWRIAADALAERLRRYPFAQEAARGKPLFVSKRMPRPAATPPTLLWEYLSPVERKAIKNYLHPEYDAVSRVDGKPMDPETAPVVILGDSYAPLISTQLAKAINLPVATHSVDGSSTQPLKELLRIPKALPEARVVIWVASYGTYLLMDWNGLPDVVMKMADAPPPASATESLGPSTAAIEERTQRVTLPSGMKLVLYPKETRGTTITSMLNIHYGTAEELFNRRAEAQLAPQMLLRGTKTRSRQQIQDELKKLEARVTITGSGATTVVSAETVREKFPAVLKLLAEILRSPGFPVREFEQLRDSTIAGLEKNRSEPQFLAMNALSRHLYPYPQGDIRSILSADEQLDGIRKATLGDVKKFYSDFFGASQAEFSIVGDFEAGEVRGLLTELFGDWKSPRAFREISRPYAKIPAENRVIETAGKTGSAFVAGLRLDLGENDEDYPALLLGTQMLGVGAGSRLAKRIREKDGLAYTIATNLGAGSLEKGGLLLTLALDPKGAPQDVSKVEQAFKDELALVLKDGFTAKEVADAKAAWRRTQQASRLQDSVLARKLAANESINRTMAWDAELEKKVAALTPAQIVDALRRNLNTDGMTIVKAADFQRYARKEK
ncbi:MAG TPA: insulinase family protein [Bryobacteraceae bacterium]